MEERPGGSFRYAAFISYRHVEPDRRWALWLHSALETYRVPAALVRAGKLPPRVGRVFRDEEELSASADLSTSIDEALQQSRFLIVICSPRAPGSEWVNREVERFRELGRDEQILALLIEGEPIESFPRALREIRRRVADESGTGRETISEIEPLAADVRPVAGHAGAGGHGGGVGHLLGRGHARRSAKLRLIATVLGVRFDDLRQREQERRMRRVVYMAAGGAVVALAMIALAVVAFAQRNEAGRQRRQAENLAVEAVRQQGIAQRSEAVAAEQRALALDTLNGLIFEVQDKLDRPGLTDVRQDVLNLAAAGLERVERSAKSAGGRADRATGVIHQKLGDLYLLLGRTADARATYGHALEMFERLAAITGSPQERRDVAVTYDRLGDAARQMGDTAAAKPYYERAADIAQALYQLDSYSPATHQSLAVAFNKLGVVELDLGNLPAAAAQFNRALGIREALARKAPGDLTVRRDLALSYGRLGDLSLRGGDAAAARKHYEAALAITVALSAADPKSADGQRWLSVNYSRLGDAARAAGDTATTKAMYEKSLAIDEALAAAEPKNTQARLDLALSHQKVGDVSLAAGDLPAAAERFGKAVAIGEGLTQTDPENAETRRNLSIAYERVGGLGLSRGDYKASRESFDKSLALREQLAADDPQSLLPQTDLAGILMQRGNVDLIDGHPADALARFTRGEKIMRALRDAGKLNGQPRYLQYLTLFEGRIAECRRRLEPATKPAG